MGSPPFPRSQIVLRFALCLSMFQFFNGLRGEMSARPMSENLKVKEPVPASSGKPGEELSAPVHRPSAIPGTTQRASKRMRATPPFAWPLKGRVTCGFSLGGRKRRHEGIDIDGELGQTIRAAAAGTVVLAGMEGRYGNALLIDHGRGLSTYYAHASRLLVRLGDRVEQGEPIAQVGRSGNARGTHLHFEVRRHDRPVNPLSLLRGGAVLTAASH